jgi:hypothetical protein
MIESKTDQQIGLHGREPDTPAERDERRDVPQRLLDNGACGWDSRTVRRWHMQEGSRSFRPFKTDADA